MKLTEALAIRHPVPPLRRRSSTGLQERFLNLLERSSFEGWGAQFSKPVTYLGFEAQRFCHRLGRFKRSSERADIDGVELLCREPISQCLDFAYPLVGQIWVIYSSSVYMPGGLTVASDVQSNHRPIRVT